MAMPSASAPEASGLVEVADDEDATLVSCAGEIDESCNGSLDRAVGLVTAARASTIIVDFTEVTFVGSIGLGFIARLYRMADLAGRTLTVRNPSPQARRVLDICGFADMITID